MGIYYQAIDRNEKLKFDPPGGFGSKYYAILSPFSPFSGMVCMKNVNGYDFEIIGDYSDLYNSNEYKDITETVYEEYLKTFTWAEEFYDCSDEKWQEFLNWKKKKENTVN